MKVDILLEDDRWGNIQNVEDLVKEVSVATLNYLEENIETGDMVISVLCSNDSSVQELNKTYRGIDKPTNVLSFPMDYDWDDSDSCDDYSDEECDAAWNSDDEEDSDEIDTYGIDTNELEKALRDLLTGSGSKEVLDNQNCSCDDSYEKEQDSNKHCNCGENHECCSLEDESHCHCGGSECSCDCGQECECDSLFENEEWPLGCMAFSYDTISKEAKEQNKSFNDHFKHLIVHGVLHLIGFDHQTDEEAEAMEQIEVDVLKSIGVDNPY